MTAVIGISLSALILAVFIKDHNKTASLVIMLAAAALIFFRIITGISDVFSSIREISSGVESAAGYIKLMLKVLGIVLITQFISDLCRDSGENALAGQTETAAKIIVISMVLPLFESVVGIISGLLQ
ncbi:MAG: hypothetical protein J1E05_00365 [Eubacterium sp.]|nr:hypothetical protein [Eubacterium sp.]